MISPSFLFPSFLFPSFLFPTARLELERCVRCQREDHGVARRANSILLLNKGKSCAAIAEYLYLDDDTIRRWYKTYVRDGWEVLAIDGWQGGQSANDSRSGKRPGGVA